MTKLPRYVTFIALLFCFPTLVFGQPMFAAESEGVRIVLMDEPCALPAVTNLPNRATWTEKGKTFEGCWGVSPTRMVMGYFDDKTVAVIPIQMFQKVVGV